MMTVCGTAAFWRLDPRFVTVSMRFLKNVILPVSNLFHRIFREPQSVRDVRVHSMRA